MRFHPLSPLANSLSPGSHREPPIPSRLMPRCRLRPDPFGSTPNRVSLASFFPTSFRRSPAVGGDGMSRRRHPSPRRSTSLGLRIKGQRGGHAGERLGFIGRVCHPTGFQPLHGAETAAGGPSRLQGRSAFAHGLQASVSSKPSDPNLSVSRSTRLLLQDVLEALPAAGDSIA